MKEEVHLVLQFFFCPNLISWWSKKPPIATRSNTEAEIEILFKSLQIYNGLKHFLKNCSFQPRLHSLYMTQSSVFLDHNPIMHSMTNHMKINMFLLERKCWPNSLESFMSLAQINGLMCFASLLHLQDFLLSCTNLGLLPPVSLCGKLVY